MMHKCPVDGCGAMIQREQLMCYQHWRKVPGELQRLVIRTWNDGQIGAVYMQAREKAIGSVDAQRVNPTPAPQRAKQLQLL
jgi:hypothetical protein